MEIDWMTRDELAQSIPPAYTKFLGDQIMRILLSPDRSPFHPLADSRTPPHCTETDEPFWK
jgi:hypothetical protein